MEMSAHPQAAAMHLKSPSSAPQATRTLRRFIEPSARNGTWHDGYPQTICTCTHFCMRTGDGCHPEENPTTTIGQGERLLTFRGLASFSAGPDAGKRRRLFTVYLGVARQAPALSAMMTYLMAQRTASRGPGRVNIYIWAMRP